MLNLSVFQTLKEKHEIEKAEILEASNKQMVNLVQEAMPSMDDNTRKTVEDLLESNSKSMNSLRDLI